MWWLHNVDCARQSPVADERAAAVSLAKSLTLESTNRRRTELDLVAASLGSLICAAQACDTTSSNSLRVSLKYLF